MSEPVTITRLEAENVKRVKAVALTPDSSGLTIIGGRNNQGKTSVLDAIAWALGGARFKPSAPYREGSITPPDLHVELSNGLVVERRGKNSELKVTDPSGTKSGQGLLDSFVEQLALDLPRFLNSTSKEKAQTLLQIIGVGERLLELQSKEQQLYDKRHALGQIADQKAKAAAEMTYHPEVPAAPISASELIQRQQAILMRNGENHKKREQAKIIDAQCTLLVSEIESLEGRMKAIRTEWEEKSSQLDRMREDAAIAQKSAEQLSDESTAEIEASIANIEETNARVRTNQAKTAAQAEAKDLKAQYEQLTAEVEETRRQQTALLDGADLPLPGLSVIDGDLTYKGVKWDGMSASEQLRVATAIVRKLNPKCGFVLLDKLEQMDIDTLREFNKWLKEQGLQVIATRVSTGEECAIVIEDGLGQIPAAQAQNTQSSAAAPAVAAASSGEANPFVVKRYPEGGAI